MIGKKSFSPDANLFRMNKTQQGMIYDIDCEIIIYRMKLLDKEQ